MEDLEYLESMKQSVATVIHIINLKFDPKKKQLFTVFEGKEDRTYYIPRIKILLKDYAYDEIVEVIAYCKNNVISVNESIDWNRYSYNQFIFFTDTDLDYWLNKATPEASNLYYTDYYSVEMAKWLDGKGISRPLCYLIYNAIEIAVRILYKPGKIRRF